MDPYSDRSWMNQRKSGKQIGASPQFRQGVEVFLDFAYNHPECVSEENTIRCPCAKCKNVNYFGRDTVHYHLLISGFVRNYEQCWWAHGQIRGSTITAQEDNPGSSGYRMSEMVHDMAGPDFDVCQRREEVINADAKAFLKLLEEGSEPLWDGCTEHSTLSAVATLLNIKTDHNMSNECFEKILNAVKSMLPEGEKLPSNYYHSKKMLKKLGLGYKKIDACVNDCMLYYKENEQRVRCLECGHERYRPNEEGGAAKKKLIPYKILRYFPITPRLQRLYMSSRTAEHMTWHARSPTKDGELSHPADGQAWKEMNLAYPEFASEPRNVRLGLSTDGFNPFGHSATPYSCWPVILTPYNLPPWMCMKQPYLFLSLLIPGPKSPGKNLDIYLRPLIDELKVLWHTGVETWDVSTKSNFNLKAALMWTISDFPAYGMLAGWSTHGKLACPYCMEYTKSFTLSNGRKPCWFDCHRCLLPADHPFRRNREQFRKGKVEKYVAPPQLSGRQIRDRVHKLPFLPFGLNAVSRVIAGFGVSHNWVRKSIFWELPYWSTNLIRHNLDVMHIEKNVFDNVFYTVMGITSKTKDNENAREDMKDICNRTGLNLFLDKKGKLRKPHAKYTLLEQQVKDVCNWIKSLKLPDGYASNIARCVKGEKFQGGMKSHDCHVFMERLIPVAFRNFLDKPIMDALTDLSHFFRDICSKTLNEKHMALLEMNIIEITCNLEKIFPPGFFDSMEHLPIHLPYEARVGGPVQYRWMYPFERMMGYLKRKVKNRAHVEGSISEAYSFEEISLFISEYFPDEVLTKSNRVPRHDDGGDVDLNGRLSVFGLAGRSYGKGKRIFLSEDLLRAAHTYILLNCTEIDKFVRLYDEEVKAIQPSITDQDMQLRRDTHFASWLKDKVLKDEAIPPNIQALAMGPNQDQVSRNGYKINGWEYHTKKYGCGKKTTNTGVCVQGDCADELGRAFYGELEQIIELSYKGNYGGRITLFKCRWFDSDKGIHIDRNGIIDIDLHMSTYANAPFVLPTQTSQVYYTPSPGRKRVRPPADWQVVIHIPARNRVQLIDTEFYQEEVLQRPPTINVEGNDLNLVEGVVEAADVDPASLIVPDAYELISDTESEPEDEAEEDDGYDSPIHIGNDPNSDDEEE